MNMNIDEIRGPLAGFLAAAMIFASAGTAGTAVAAQDDTVQASAARTVIQTEINAAGASAGNTVEKSIQHTDTESDDADPADI